MIKDICLYMYVMLGNVSRALLSNKIVRGYSTRVHGLDWLERPSTSLACSTAPMANTWRWCLACTLTPELALWHCRPTQPRPNLRPMGSKLAWPLTCFCRCHFNNECVEIRTNILRLYHISLISGLCRVLECSPNLVYERWIMNKHQRTLSRWLR